MLSPTTFNKESCVESLNAAIRAEQAGADRLELCSALETGGLFPGEVLLKQVLQNVSIPVSVMIRPRPGNFEYSRSELELMKAQIQYCRKMGVFGVVFGASKADQLDYNLLEELIKVSGPLSITIHKVVDMLGDPKIHIQKLAEIKGVNRVLTSGGEETAWKGRVIIKEMMRIAGDYFSIMPGGKITAANIDPLHTYLGAKEYHGRKIV